MNSATVKTYLPWVVAAALFMEQLDTTIVNTAVPTLKGSASFDFPKQGQTRLFVFDS